MKHWELAQHSAELGFTPRDAVRWLSPIALGRTGLKVAAATLFADFGDKRELEAGLPGEPLYLDRLPLPGQAAQPAVMDKGLPAPDELRSRGEALAQMAGTQAKELWLDFTADLGDGFDATYSVALLLAQERLEVAGDTLPRGNVLVLGGDEVYPVASPERYEDKMVGPYRKAFPTPAPGDSDTPPPGTCPPATLMLALPGNHDWYDGLTSFIRLFTRQRSIGAWRTVQSRSYFGVRLTGGPGSPGWWVLGLDSQLGQYIDEPQLEYFYRNVTTQLQPGDAIILCLASPYWVYSDSPSASAFRQVNFFEQDYLRRRFNPTTGRFEDTGASVRLWLSGDLHHYSRFEQDVPAYGSGAAPEGLRTQLVTCGLGGAYLADTSELPEEIILPTPITSPNVSASLPTPDLGSAGRKFSRTPVSYPSCDDGRRMGRRLANPLSPFWLPARNPGFGPLLGLIHVLFFLAGWTVFSSFRGRSLMDTLGSLEGAGLARPLIFGVLGPLVLLGALALLWKLFGTSSVVRDRKGLVTFLRGVLYQLAAMGVGLVVVAVLHWPPGWPQFLGALFALAVTFVSGWVLGSEAFALFILGTRGGEVATWMMSGQSVEDHKGFLRIHLAPDGALTVYPLAIDEICRDWALETTSDGVRPVPAKGATAAGLPAVRLLETPISISREGISP
ncbi:hypothetical protein [Arthrobacter sp. MMS18-M83]|uniref:hypothetical protein n=1 Tax=Arthrobacter sp. MMS18-M83 TaxID=2996261 RepID=UPI00227C95A5|nr:hypothetical protein [Arthrobacter sp. MMS18-M83]WAH98338.1 hypothetical protein OW521_05585 [Arthrobacter sp. MMS18-M83]